MERDEQALMVTANLRGFDLRQMVQARRAGFAVQPVEIGSQVATDPMPLQGPITPDGQLAPGVLYEAREGAGVRYYLPRYVLRTVAGRHTSRLRLRRLDEDPHGPLGWLSLELLEMPLVDANFEMRRIEHRLALQLSYDVPVAGQQGSVPAPSFAGVWVNADSATQGLTRLELSETSPGVWSVRGFGRCQPIDCDWGLTVGSVDQTRASAVLTAVWSFGFKQTVLTITWVAGRLHIDCLDDYSDSDGRADRRSQAEMVLVDAPVGVAASAPRLREALPPPNREDGGIWRTVVPIHAQADYDRYFQILSKPERQAQLELQCHATLSQRSWQQWWLPKVALDRGQLENLSPAGTLVDLDPTQLKNLRLNVLSRLKSGTIADPSPHRDDLRVRPDLDFEARALGDRERLSPMALRAATTTGFHQSALRAFQAEARQPLAITPQPMALRVAPEFGTLQDAPEAQPVADALSVDASSVASLLRPNVGLSAVRVVALQEAVLAQPDRPAPERELDAAALKPLPLSDALLQQNLVRSLPKRLMLDSQGRPVLVQRELDAVQTISLSFDPAQDAEVLQAPLEPSHDHVLFQHDVRVADRSVSFFQDSLIRDQIYYEPQSFRLARHTAAPHLPALCFAVNTVVTEEQAASYQIRMAFNALPHVDADVMILAQQQFGVQARFAALDPSGPRLQLRVPSSDGQAVMTQERPDAAVSFDDGICDELSLDEAQFLQLAAAFQAPGALGLQGTVRGQLADGTELGVPLTLSLADNVGKLFDQQFLGPEPGDAGAQGLLRVRLRNRIESPVLIRTWLPVPVEVAGSGPTTSRGVARPNDLPPAQAIAPGASLDVLYRVSPPDLASALMLSLEVAFDAVIEPDLARLLSALTVTESYEQAEFEVQVMLSAAYLGVQGLTGVKVEFELGASVGDGAALGAGPVVTLQAGQLQAQVRLKRSLLARMFNQSTVYRYRVTRLTASGEQPPEPWRSHTGDLQVILTS